jgi:hypothetical protein
MLGSRLRRWGRCRRPVRRPALPPRPRRSSAEGRYQAEAVPGIRRRPDLALRHCRWVARLRGLRGRAYRNCRCLRSCRRPRRRLDPLRCRGRRPVPSCRRHCSRPCHFRSRRCRRSQRRLLLNPALRFRRKRECPRSRACLRRRHWGLPALRPRSLRRHSGCPEGPGPSPTLRLGCLPGRGQSRWPPRHRGRLAQPRPRRRAHRPARSPARRPGYPAPHQKHRRSHCLPRRHTARPAHHPARCPVRRRGHLPAHRQSRCLQHSRHTDHPDGRRARPRSRWLPHRHIVRLAHHRSRPPGRRPAHSPAGRQLRCL